MTNANASAAAKALLEEFWDLKLPIDPKFFAEKLGIEIVSANLGLRSGFLDADKCLYSLWCCLFSASFWFYCDGTFC